MHRVQGTFISGFRFTVRFVHYSFRLHSIRFWFYALGGVTNSGTVTFKVGSFAMLCIFPYIAAASMYNSAQIM